MFSKNYIKNQTVVEILKFSTFIQRVMAAATATVLYVVKYIFFPYTRAVWKAVILAKKIFFGLSKFVWMF